MCPEASDLREDPIGTRFRETGRKPVTRKWADARALTLRTAELATSAVISRPGARRAANGGAHCLLMLRPVHNHGTKPPCACVLRLP